MRKLIFLVWSLVATLWLTPGVAGAQTLYGIAYSGNDGSSTLYTVSTTDGTATAVGAVGFERCSGMDFGAAGSLFATCERADGSDTPVLVAIDPATGAGTEIGPTGFSGNTSDVSFRNSDGVLFAYDALNDPDHSLFTIDTTTGAGTLVGDTGLAFAGGNGMTFDLADVLYQSQFTGGPAPDLNTLDPTDGQPTFIGQVPPLTGRFSALDTHPVSGVIYGVVNDGAGGGGPSSLATLDPAGPTAMIIGLTQSGLDAIAFAPLPAPPVIEVPALGSTGLMSLGLALAAAGLWWLSVRRARSSAP